MFGSEAHQFRLGPTLTDDCIISFEREHGVVLPPDYRAFLGHCGNGGAGPYYGLFPLGQRDDIGVQLQRWYEDDGSVGRLAEPFPHTEPWNFPEQQLVPPDFSNELLEDAWHEQRDAVYWAPDLMNGAFPICHQGCAYRNILVVTGTERGRIWLDARASYGGILPEVDDSGNHQSFTEWYTVWLNGALVAAGLK